MGLTFDHVKLSRSHQRVADYILKHIDGIPFMVEEDIASACEVSVSTVSRFWAEIECRNLKEFKNRVKKEGLISPTRKLQSAFERLEEQGSTTAQIMDTVDYLQQTADRLEQKEFDRAVRMLTEANTIHIYAPGSARALAELLQFRLTRFGNRVRTMDYGGHEILEYLIHLRTGDAVVMFGFVSESPEMATLFDYARQCGCHIILLTDLVVSDMRQKADVALYTARGEVWEFHSMAAPLVMLEALIVAVGKSQEQKAMRHGEELHRLRRQYSKWLPKRV
ncbi:MurR/RpiR family transcriptional regulator [Paenibacillus kandeliae]|uniref:MurR/RpiR family transcriptional regulator n=1 Tax=Paenibacillus kandeliae TaxID=3231269 RepID=UPI00345ABC06